MARLDEALRARPVSAARFYRTVASALAGRLVKVYADPDQLRGLLA